jgi:photosystem II stability/assembly factor-like uncharacterized protein
MRARLRVRTRAAALAALTLAAAGDRAAPQERVEQAPPIVTSLTVFAGTPRGLYRSSDWGGTWYPVVRDDKTFGLDEVGAVRDIVPIGPQVFLAGDGGVYQSDDFGLNWHRTAFTTPAARVLPSRYPGSDLSVFVATPAGLVKSDDGGRSFKPTALTGTPVYHLEWPGPALIVGSGRGLMVSLDAGGTFASGVLPPGPVRAFALSSFFAMDPVLFAAVGSAGVHRSADAGKTWAPAGLEGETVTDLAWLGPYLYAVAGTGVYRSEDMGKKWIALGVSSKAAPTRILFPLMPASGSDVFLGTVKGIYRSSDGGQTWKAAGLDDQPILCLATFPQVPISDKPPKR